MDASSGFMIGISVVVILAIILFNNKEVEDEIPPTDASDPDPVDITSPQEIAWLKEDLAAARETGDQPEESNLLATLGSIHYQLGQYEEAIAFHQQAMDVDWEIGNRPGQCANLGSLGNAHAILGQHEKAIEYYLQQLEITRQLHDLKGEGRALSKLADNCTALDQHEDAIDHLELALNIFQMTGNREAEINIINSLVNASSLLEQHQEAIAYCQKKLENAIADNDRLVEVQTEWQIGLLYEKLDDFDEAIHHMQRTGQFLQGNLSRRCQSTQRISGQGKRESALEMIKQGSVYQGSVTRNNL